MMYLYPVTVTIIGLYLFLIGQPVSSLLVYWAFAIGGQLLILFITALPDILYKFSPSCKLNEAFAAANKCADEYRILGFVYEDSAGIFADKFAKVYRCCPDGMDPICEQATVEIRSLVKFHNILSTAPKKKKNIESGLFAAIERKPVKEEV